ncbi:hypothetical protein [Polyangium spumosum]|uniref:Tetratricopeptide repeat protein n=1 Tax=Polyangium spumosum TaxID=889282 RepID=A0A6N7PXK1_9BACT|nr:hypothetical protein [Polyangium spumosum]MRG94955.1 hypothetical protein [Polyangium spumosum]
MFTLRAGVFVLLLGLAASARAEPAAPEPRARAKTSFERAERAAAELRFGEALAGYEAVLSIDPSAPFAKVARARAADLRAHAEGDFAPLARLEAVRRTPSPDRATIEALARDAATFPPGRVRAEAWLIVAEAFWHRFGAPDRAASALGEAIADPSADKLTRALALNELVALERERGDLAAAHHVVSRFPDLVPSLHAEIGRLVRREKLARAAAGVLGLLGLIGAFSIARLFRRPGRDPEAIVRAVVRPSSVAFALYLGGAAAILVRHHGDGDVRPFLWLGFGVLGVDIVARAWRLGSRDGRAAARIGRAALCMIGVLAVAFLSLEGANAGYLESFGL